MLFCDLFVFKEDLWAGVSRSSNCPFRRAQMNRTNAPPPRMMDKGSWTKTMLMFRISSEAGSTAARLLNWSFFEKWRSDVTNERHRTERGGGFPDSWNSLGSGIGWKSNLASLACFLRCLLECFSFLIKTIVFEIQELNCTQFRHPFRDGLFVNLHKKLS